MFSASVTSPFGDDRPSPPEDAAREHVEHRGDIEPALVGPHVGDVGDPQLVGSIGGEVAVDETRRRCRGVVSDRRAGLLAAVHALDARSS